jgi:hypothetical protein
VRHGRSKAGTIWTHSLIGYGLDRFHRQHLRAPTQREVRAGIPDLPSYATIQRIYGSFGGMLASHGFLVRPRGGSRGRDLQLNRDHQGRFLPGKRTPARAPAPTNITDPE